MNNGDKWPRIGVAMTGSFCTFQKVFDALEKLRGLPAELVPIMSFNAYSLNTRFFTAQQARDRLEGICGRECLHTIEQVEPIGPKKLLDLVLVAPCTGNTLAKLAHGIADTPVTMACKSQLRNERPVLIALSTNDGLAASAANIGTLMRVKHVFFAPFGQDDCVQKSTSLVFDENRLMDAVRMALKERQAQPLIGELSD